MSELFDNQVRVAAFQWLAEQVSLHGEVLPRALLARGFQFEDQRVPLVSPQGIFKPRILELPLSITTVFGGPYDDSFTEDRLVAYCYRGTDPNHPDNAGLRKAMKAGVPLIYLHGVVPGRYLAVWPVYVVGDDLEKLTFRVAIDDVDAAMRQIAGDSADDLVADDASARRAYITSTYRRRLHQHAFRERVLRAYREQCALCRLRHQELLDAAHIIPDREPGGEPRVPTGLALCKLHHTAFDRYFLAVTPDYRIEIRDDILEEIDGPMLQHGLQGLHGKLILLPSRTQLRPDRDLLAQRYESFKKVS